MNGAQGRDGRLDPQTFQQRFNSLSEKRKLELSLVVAGITQKHSKVAAQRWLEQQLGRVPADEPTSAALLQPRDTPPGLDDGSRRKHAALAHKLDELTPSRDALAAHAPTTLTELSAEARAYQGAVRRAEPFTRRQLDLISSALTQQSRKVLEFLHFYACSYALSQEQSLKAQQISFFLPAETISLVTKVRPRTVYDALKRLKALGLIDHRGHVTTLPGYGNRCDGTVFAVKLGVLKSGDARVAYADLKKADYRDLAADISAGRTVHRLAQSTWVFNLRAFLCVLLSWTNSKCTVSWNIDVSNPRFLTVQASSRSGLEAVLEVTTGATANRGRRISTAATAIARAFGDQHSLTFWWKFCDALAFLVECGGRDYAPAIVAAMQREVAAKQEGFARSAAALFIARLKQSGVYGEIMTA